MGKIGIAIHGGAGPDSPFIKSNVDGYREGLKEAITSAYKFLQEGKPAIDVVEEAVRKLEDNPLFNAGRGSAVNNRGEVEMDASIMDGKTLKAGAVSMVRNVKNPITLARAIMEKTNHILLSGYGALDFARDMRDIDIELEADAYFITEHQYDEYMEVRDKENLQDLFRKYIRGTVGAVALDKDGNLAAATSTGGTTNSLAGRIGDSCLIGAGCYANNKTCAVSGTGDGEFLISGVIAHSIASAIEYLHCSMQEACDLVVHKKNKDVPGNIGVISINGKGEFGISYNSSRMHRAWISDDEPLHIISYKD